MMKPRPRAARGSARTAASIKTVGITRYSPGTLANPPHTRSLYPISPSTTPSPPLPLQQPSRPPPLSRSIGGISSTRSIHSGATLQGAHRSPIPAIAGRNVSRSQTQNKNRPAPAALQHRRPDPPSQRTARQLQHHFPPQHHREAVSTITSTPLTLPPTKYSYLPSLRSDDTVQDRAQRRDGTETAVPVYKSELQSQSSQVSAGTERTFAIDSDIDDGNIIPAGAGLFADEMARFSEMSVDDLSNFLVTLEEQQQQRQQPLADPAADGADGLDADDLDADGEVGLLDEDWFEKFVGNYNARTHVDGTSVARPAPPPPLPLHEPEWRSLQTWEEQTATAAWEVQAQVGRWGEGGNAPDYVAFALQASTAMQHLVERGDAAMHGGNCSDESTARLELVIVAAEDTLEQFEAVQETVAGVDLDANARREHKSLRTTARHLADRMEKWEITLHIRQLVPGDVWKCPVEGIPLLVDRAIRAGKTPLLIDAAGAGQVARHLAGAGGASADGGGAAAEDGATGDNASITVSEEQHGLLGHIVTIDGAKLDRMTENDCVATTSPTVQAEMTTSLAAAQEELRQQLVKAFETGVLLHVALGSSAPEFGLKVCSPTTFPREVFSTHIFTGTDPRTGRTRYAGRSLLMDTADIATLLGDTDDEVATIDDAVSDPDFSVAVVLSTTCAADEYAAFLARKVPYIGDAQPIVIISQETPGNDSANAADNNADRGSQGDAVDGGVDSSVYSNGGEEGEEEDDELYLDWTVDVDW